MAKYLTSLFLKVTQIVKIIPFFFCFLSTNKKYDSSIEGFRIESLNTYLSFKK